MLTFPAQTWPESEKSAPSFNVLTAYEDFEMGKQAKRTYEFLQQHLGHDCRFTHTMWKFDILALPKLWEIAVKDATLADIMIVSCRGNTLPGYMESWIEAWLTGEHRALALVALFEEHNEEQFGARELREYLASAAERGRLEFFTQPGDWDGVSTHKAVGSSNTGGSPQPQLGMLAEVIRSGRSTSVRINE